MELTAEDRRKYRQLIEVDDDTVPTTVERMTRLRKLHNSRMKGMMAWNQRLRDLDEHWRDAVAHRSSYAEDARGVAIAAWETICRMEPEAVNAIPDPEENRRFCALENPTGFEEFMYATGTTRLEEIEPGHIPLRGLVSVESLGANAGVSPGRPQHVTL